ncbi:Uncharacterized protein OS=Isosphaera pallida (strain ATCC 43644 / DSM 9630 / IS1B) GN=Isop_0716 PE=4 SV=1: SBP_bac_10 [Gemmata massiliana]|uniref:DUF1559 domain-containing protein n=1 Tax=Gemmata massiliana TaxID=1210884 RepID=A0A6P2D0Q3_9BACT|nr:DUF1559 domain-containing protein [Gemmata massiliana]VTR94831.1 Uncharacterized protein OS=Isosphaera pallida (strain ATCC 43644 / DSM 9630 / IS1B) GN=Isop_0716 PE=4 SV=1: SBP_bac_10 [Gemmata massiliana]
MRRFLCGALALIAIAFSTLDATESQALTRTPQHLKPDPKAVANPREVATVAPSANNLRRIAIAMHEYSDTNGVLPPAAYWNKAGQACLSWRVLILPQLGHEALYKQFKLDEPWDSEHNKKLLAKMPSVYATPGLTKSGSTETYYRVFVGNGAGFDWIFGTLLIKILDGTVNTIMCTIASTSVPWSKPDELEFDPEKDPTKLFGALPTGQPQVVMFDGTVKTLKKLPSKETLKLLIQRNDGQVIPDDF